MKNYLTEWKKFKYSTKEGAADVGAGGSITADSTKVPVSIQDSFEREFSQNASHSGDIAGAKFSISGNASGKLSADMPSGVPSLTSEELTEDELEEASGCHEGLDEAGQSCQLELQYEEIEEEKQCNECRDCTMCGLLTEAKYKGKKVKLNKPMRGDVKKFKVYVRDPKTGNVKKVNFGDKKMRIKKSNPKRRKSFRARHRCANPGPKTKARYWSCRKW